MANEIQWTDAMNAVVRENDSLSPADIAARLNEQFDTDHVTATAVRAHRTRLRKQDADAPSVTPDAKPPDDDAPAVPLAVFD